MFLISFCFCPLSRYLRGVYRLAVVAPRTALVIDDIGDLGVTERGGKRRHGAAVDHPTDLGVVEALQHHLDMLRGVVLVDDSVVLELRERAWQAFTIGLMAGRAVGSEQCGTFRRIVTTGG